MGGEGPNLYQRTVEGLKGRAGIKGALASILDAEIDAIAKSLTTVSVTSDKEFTAAPLAETPAVAGESAAVALATTHFFQALTKAREKEAVMFSVPATPPAVTALSRAGAPPYTLLTHSLRTASELKEIGRLSNYTEPVVQAIAFTPERMALQTFARELVLNYSLGKEGKGLDTELASLVPVVVADFMATHPGFPEEMRLFREKTQAEVQAHLTSGSELAPDVREVYEQVLSKVSPEASMSEAERRQAIAMKVADMVYKRRVESELKSFDLSSCDAVKALKPLPPQTGEARSITMINGGIASGKGTAEGEIMREAAARGVDWRDVLVVNTDSFKRMLLDPATLSEEDKPHFSGLTHDEASLIRSSIMEEYTKRLQENRAPHLHVDQVWTEERLVTLAAGSNPRGIDITMVQVPAERSFQMAFGRGVATGRFESTVGILNTHRGVPRQLLDTLSKLKPGSNVRIRLVDNVAKDRVEEAAYIDISKGEGSISKRAAVLEFFKKRAIDPSATTFDAMYEDESSMPEAHMGSIDQLRALCPLKFVEKG